MDGQLDCTDGRRWDVQSEIDPSTAGTGAAEEAVAHALDRYASRQAMHLDGDFGTVVVDGREVVRATATQLDNSTWVSALQEGCAADSQFDTPVATPTPSADAAGGRPSDGETAAPRPTPSYGETGRWTDAAGDPVPHRAIVRLPGPEHCDWERVTFVEIDWPLLGVDVPAASGAYVDDLSAFPPESAIDATGPPPFPSRRSTPASARTRSASGLHPTA